MKKNKIKTIIGATLAIVALIAVLVAAIWALVFKFMNPDMTEMRLFLENPQPTIIAIASVIVLYVAKVLVGEN